MIEQKIDIEIISTDFHMVLASHERESLSEFKEEIADIVKQSPFEIPFLCLGTQTEEIEDVWILEGLMRKVGVCLREGLVEVSNCFSLSTK